MYQAQVGGMKQDILLNGGFEGCTVSGETVGIQLVGIRKIPNLINQGRHHLFIDLEDYRGNDYFCLLNSTLRYGFNKPPNEVGCHIDFYGTENSLRIYGSLPSVFSQLITGLSFAHTQYGHSSYYIYAKLGKGQTVPPPKPDNKALWLIGEIEQRLKELKEIIK